MPPNPTKYEEFEQLVSHDHWLGSTIDQFVKDVQMAGLEPPKLSTDLTLDGCIEAVSIWLERMNRTSMSFQNLNYRIDLPRQTDPFTMIIEDLAALYLFRCFQKVWLRKHFAQGDVKDSGSHDQKHLKP